MNLTRQIINEKKGQYPEFEYYISLIEVIEEKFTISPDMTIETCKSLVEGIAKTILNNLDSNIEHSKDAHDVFRQALDVIEKKTFIEIKYIRRVVTFVQVLAEIRNSRADISHGKATPKEQITNEAFAISALKTTDAMLYYILTHYFQVLEQEEVIEEKVQYEDNPKYNELLDENNSIGNIIYSKALYEQDYDNYYEGLVDYLNSMEESNE
jgi:hypothetical protein